MTGHTGSGTTKDRQVVKVLEKKPKYLDIVAS